jgi:hypothetical protein
MARELEQSRQPDRSDAGRNRLKASMRLGPLEADVNVDVTTKGLLAIGGLVSAILLSVVPIVYAATRKVPPAD